MIIGVGIVTASLSKLYYKTLRWAVIWLMKLLLAPFKLGWLFFKNLGLAIWATPGILLRLPLRLFKGIVRARNWTLDKVNYLEQESQKWRTTFTLVKSPYTLLTKMGFSPNMAASLLIGTSAVGGGVVINETILTEKSFARGDAGIYAAPTDVPVMWNETFNTLRIDLGATPVKEISITDVSVGNIYSGSSLPSGATTTIDIGGSGTASTFLEVGTLTFEKNRCDTLLLTDVKAHKLIIEGNASDGQSIAPSAGTIRDRAVLGGNHMAAKMNTKGGTYDRVWINAQQSGVNGKIDKLVISNAYTRGGGCWLHDIRAGTVEILRNEIGQGDGLSNKDLLIETSVSGQIITNNNNVEIALALPATVTADS